jgi:hypothetical protein
MPLDQMLGDGEAHPRPPWRRVDRRVALAEALEDSGQERGSMPWPESRMTIRSVLAIAMSADVDAPAVGENLIALPSRLLNTCCRRPDRP